MASQLRSFRIGTPRAPGEGLRIGAVRFLPRGVKKADYARLDYFDVWLPTLAPEAELVKRIRAAAQAGKDATPLFRRYRQWLLKDTGRKQTLLLLKTLAERTPLALGCYCEDEAKCHRSALLAAVRELA